MTPVRMALVPVEATAEMATGAWRRSRGYAGPITRDHAADMIAGAIAAAPSAGRVSRETVERVASRLTTELGHRYDDLPERATYLQRKTLVDKTPIDKVEARELAIAALTEAGLEIEGASPTPATTGEEAADAVAG